VQVIFIQLNWLIVWLITKTSFRYAGVNPGLNLGADEEIIPLVLIIDPSSMHAALRTLEVCILFGTKGREYLPRALGNQPSALPSAPRKRTSRCCPRSPVFPPVKGFTGGGAGLGGLGVGWCCRRR
jgi:hypothetical protein